MHQGFTNSNQSMKVASQARHITYRTSSRNQSEYDNTSGSLIRFSQFNLFKGGHKHEKFVVGIFTLIRPVWVGELEARPKTSTN
jgi:hypothetical protein